MSSIKKLTLESLANSLNEYINVVEHFYELSDADNGNLDGKQILEIKNKIEDISEGFSLSTNSSKEGKDKLFVETLLLIKELREEEKNRIIDVKPNIKKSILMKINKSESFINLNDEFDIIFKYSEKVLKVMVDMFAEANLPGWIKDYRHNVYMNNIGKLKSLNEGLQLQVNEVRDENKTLRERVLEMEKKLDSLLIESPNPPAQKQSVENKIDEMRNSSGQIRPNHSPA